MKFSVTSNELQKYLSVVNSIIPSKTVSPILESYLFELSGNNLRITSTDTIITITANLTVNGIENGKVVIPAKRFYETIKVLPNTTINFYNEANSPKIELYTDIGEYKLLRESKDEFPTSQAIKLNYNLRISNEILRRIISKTEFAVSKDELRPSMMGVLLQFRSNEIRAVSTDGHRLVQIINSSFTSSKPERDIIVPVKALSIVLKCLDNPEANISLDEKNIQFSFGNITILSRLIDEKYPNYEAVIPLNNDKRLIVDRNLLLSSIKRTALYSNIATHLVRLSLSKDFLVVSAEDIDYGIEAKEKISCEFTSEPMEIGFNYLFLIDILTHIDSDEVQFLLNSSSRAAIVKPNARRSDEDILMLVMPIRLNA